MNKKKRNLPTTSSCGLYMINKKHKKNDQDYNKGGLVHSLHGNIYQLKLSMLFLYCGTVHKYSFRLATEWDEAEKFDDVVFQYTENNKTVYRFLQAKHKQDESKKISINDLLTEKDEEFSLQKYFLSYRKIKQKSEFNATNVELKDFVICTNIDLDDDLQNSFERMVDIDNIIDVVVRNNSKEFKRLKFKKNDYLRKESIMSIFHKVSDLKMLAKKLVYHVFNNKTINLRDELFKKYHGAIAEKVIDIKTKKFKIDFINDSSNLPKEVKKFRKALLDESKLSENAFKSELQTKKIEVSDKFGNVLKLEKNPIISKNQTNTSNQTPDSIKELSKLFVDLISKKNTNKVIEIDRKASIIKENINKLTGHVFVETKNDIIIFRQGFLNDDKLPGNLNDFREGLKTELLGTNKGIQFSQLGQYQVKINIDTCTEEDYEEYKKDENYFERFLPNDEVGIEEIDEFLDKLVLAVNQPNEVELGKIIKAEMSKHKDINLIDSELVASMFLKDMLDWMKEKKGRFLTHEDGQEFFNVAKQKISKLVLIGPTLEYCAKIEAFGISFSEEITGLWRFLNSNDKQIFNLINSHGTILGSIKVYQTLKKISKYKKDDSYIFIPLSSLLLIQFRVIQAFGSKSTNNLLVIECETNKDGIQELCDQLYEVIEFDGTKKIILITSEDNVLAEELKEYSSRNNRYDEQKDGKNSFIDVTPDSQGNLGKGKVTFQGKEVSLGTLIKYSSQHLIDGEILFSLINNQKVEIGKAFDDLGDVKDYYIDRVFNRQVKVKDECFIATNIADIFAVSNIEQDELYKQVNKEKDDNRKKVCRFVSRDLNDSNPDRFIVLDNETAENNFKQLSHDYPTHNIHWLQKEGDKFIWKQSYGTSLSNIRNYLDYQNEKTIEVDESAEFISNESCNKVVIVSAEPGMGKSTTLSNLALNLKKSYPSLWIVRINLLDYASDLDKRNNIEFNDVEAIQFLYRTVGFQLFQKKEGGQRSEQSIETILSLITVENSEISLEDEEIRDMNLSEIKLFNHFYNEGSVALLFDGFDEISPDHKEKVISLLATLKDTKASKIWVTTRPYDVQYELEDKLNVFSYSLKPLLHEEQRRFLRTFWKENLKLGKLDEQRSGIFIDELLSKFCGSTSDKKREFVGIPLHIHMLAEIFQDTFKEFYDVNDLKLSDEYYKHKFNKELNLVTLYEKFMSIKIDKILFKEKMTGTNTGAPHIKRLLENNRKKIIENHRKLAVYGMLKEDILKKLLSEQEITKVHDLIKTIKEGDEKTGIIDRVVDSKPIFIHQTFAEYFTSDYLWEKFKSIKLNKFNEFLKDVIIDNVFTGNKLQICKFFYLTAHRDLEKGVDFPGKDSKIVTLLESLVDSGTDGSKGIDNLYAITNRPHYISPDYTQSIKLLFNAAESFLLGKEAGDCEAIRNVIKKEKSLSLLCISADVGCINFAKIFISTIKYNYKRSLKVRKWSHTPLWLAAKNDHLDMVDLLKEIYKPNWHDKKRSTLCESIFYSKEFNVLKSCLILGVIDGQPYRGINERELPVVAALHTHAPSDVIKLLIEKTDIDHVNNFKCVDGYEAVESISIGLLEYDKEIIELAIKKGIAVPTDINTLLCKFIRESLNSPIDQLTFANHRNLSSHFDEKMLNLLNNIEMLLKGGMGYNYRNTRYQTIQYAMQICHIHKLLGGVHKLHEQKNYKSSRPSDTILKLIIDCISKSSNFTGFKLIAYSGKVSLNLFYGKILLLVINYNDGSINLVESTLNKLRFYIEYATEDLERFKKYPDSKTCKNTFRGYEHMLDTEQKINQYESLSRFAKDLLDQVLTLYIRQDYDINDALKEVSDEVSKSKRIMNRLLEINNVRDIYGVEEIFDILDMKSISTNKELQNLISKIYKCGGIELLIDTVSYLRMIGQKNVMEVLKSMSKFSYQSSQILKLLNKFNK